MSDDAASSTRARLSGELGRLHGYLTTLFGLATRRALRLHADEVSVEHLVGAAMDDEDCAAYAIVEHAFADPETLSQELLALSTGIMVVGSGAALPFSTLALGALRAARAAAAPGAQVDPSMILGHAAAALPEAARESLAQAGFTGPVHDGGEPPAAESPDPVGFFARFSGPGKAALSRANKRSSLASEPSISPARLLLACLESDPGLARQCGLTAHRALQALAGHTLDATEVPARELAPEAQLLDFLAGLPAGAGSLEVLAACHTEAGSPELAELLRRHMVTPALLERSIGAFGDPPGTSAS